MAVMQSIEFDSETWDRLTALGKLRQRSPHWLMRQAIEDYLGREEQVEREKFEDLERWQSYQLTGEVVGHEALLTWLQDLADGKATPQPD